MRAADLERKRRRRKRLVVVPQQACRGRPADPQQVNFNLSAGQDETERRIRDQIETEELEQTLRRSGN